MRTVADLLLILVNLALWAWLLSDLARIPDLVRP